ncbi:ubiquitin--protein ligase [Ancylostoma duodenale]|uniref:Ubiquitin--protein ligase n=1 Tax=Ancylostoma duodenale TaxID=51022 RepID=A0A0C2C352_9BILA|nr:ubiquitin--protein ligase [Ancylostoma duodenale]
MQVESLGVPGARLVLDECLVGGDSSDFVPNRKFYATVFKEHKMLTEHVPDSIHVHAFASRLNVIHVLIVGPSGTPFDSTPFYFTIKLPSDYPEKPPEASYSQEQLNPNLYQSGKVCTSLLGTWSGQGVETWNPSKSNLLQVLLSIQVPEPYYNEAGYESRKQQTEMADRSKRYNETATINSLEYLLKFPEKCRKVIYKDPPSDFKELVKDIVEKEWPGYCFF